MLQCLHRTVERPDILGSDFMDQELHPPPTANTHSWALVTKPAHAARAALTADGGGEGIPLSQQWPQC
jgi:hypothetical protein